MMLLRKSGETRRHGHEHILPSHISYICLYVSRHRKEVLAVAGDKQMSFEMFRVFLFPFCRVDFPTAEQSRKQGFPKISTSLHESLVECHREVLRFLFSNKPRTAPPGPDQP